MQVVSDLDIGGAQEVVRTLVENLAEIGATPVVCAFKDGPLRQDIERLGIPVEILPDRRYSIVVLPLFVMEMIRFRRALCALAQKYQIDVMQTQLIRILDFLVLTLRYRSNLLVFWTFQNAYFTLREDHLSSHKWLLRPKQFAYRLLYGLTERWVNGFIAVSNDVKTDLVNTFGTNPDKITVICNSVDVRRYQQPVDRASIRGALGLAENACLMAVVATFKQQKGHRYLIEAAQPVISQFPNTHILLIGDGELRQELEAQTRASGLGGHIHFLGFRQDIPDLLAASDYFVLPSLWEGLPMALIEAMASGLPVLATEVSGSKQVIVPGETGLLVAPGNVPELQEAMITLLSQPEQSKTMGLAAQQRVATFFGAKKQAEAHLALFQRERKSSSTNCESS